MRAGMTGWPQTVWEADARRYALGNWRRWPVPEMPDLDVVPWDNDGWWSTPIIADPIDVDRTAALPGVDVSITTAGGGVPYEGVSYGQPFNLIDGVLLVPVLDKSRPGEWTPIIGYQWPWEWVPLPFQPDVVRREGDPVGAFDKHWIGWDPDESKLYEAIQLNKSIVDDPATTFELWTAGWDGSGPPIARWDTTRPWNADGQPFGVVATGVPLFPMVARFDEYARGSIDHALFCGFPNYANEWVAPARGGDGDLVGHPVRGGERLRLREEHVDLADPFSVAAYEFGLFVGDRNAHTPGDYHGTARFTITQDRRWQTVTLPTWSLSDFEVVA